MKHINILAILSMLPFGFILNAETEGNTSVAAENTPVISKQISPEYPYQSLLMGEQGTVNVELLVSPSGEVIAVGAVDKTTYPQLARAAIAAMKHWKFENREAVSDQPYMVKIPVNFTISEDRKIATTQIAVN